MKSKTFGGVCALVLLLLGIPSAVQVGLWFGYALGALVAAAMFLCVVSILRSHQAQALRLRELQEQFGEVSHKHQQLESDRERDRQEQLHLQLAEKVFACSSEGILITDAATHIVQVNDAFCSTLGIERERLLGKKLHSLRGVIGDASFYVSIRRSLRQSGKWSGEYCDRDKDGAPRVKWFSINAVLGTDGQIAQYVVIASDITRARQTEDDLYRLVHFDHLTEIPNRRMFRDQLQLSLNQAQRYGRELALLFIDLDRFKNVNDTLGHRAGDQLLTQVAGRLGSVLRNTDLLSRFGGDEFAVLLVEKASQRDAVLVARRLLEQFLLPFSIDGHDVYVSASIGISLYGSTGNDPEQLLKEADIAMYYAKEQGRNNFQFYCREINHHTTSRLALERDLRKAIETDQLFLNYQPKVDLETGMVTGMEALARWRHPTQGLVSPGEFIPLAEEVGLIDAIGEIVLRQGCEQLRRWKDQGLPAVRLAVNLSARQFVRLDLVKDIKRVLEQTRVEPFLLELEITEGTLLKDIDFTVRVLGELRALGVSVAIDDFGTGYSSLSYLKRLPIDSIKIDQSFVREESLGADNAAIITAVIAMAHGLGLKVVAEGVESEAILGFLRMRGCDEAQGYYLSRPLDTEGFSSYLKEYSVSKKVVPVGWSQAGEPIGHA